MKVSPQGRWFQALPAVAALVAATLAGIVPASAQDSAEPGYCDAIAPFIAVWYADPTSNADYETQVSEGQLLYDAAYASIGVGDPEGGLLQEGLYVFPGLTSALAADVAAVGGHYLDVPAAIRAEHRAKIVQFMNGLSGVIAPYCSSTPPVGALVGPCSFGPVTLPRLLGVITRGSPVEATVGDQVYVMGSTLDPSDRSASELVFVEVDEGTTQGDVLLDGQPALVAEVACSDVTGSLTALGDYPTLVNATFTPGCPSPKQSARLSLEPNKTLLEAVGIQALHGGVGAPFRLTVEVDGAEQVVPMPVGAPLELDPGANAPTVKVNGQPVDVTTVPVSCADGPSGRDDAPSSRDDAPSSRDDAPSGKDEAPATTAPLSPKFTG